MLGASARSRVDCGVSCRCGGAFSSLPLLVADVLGVLAPSAKSESTVMIDKAEASLVLRP